MGDKVYVKVRETVRNKNFYENGAEGYGWAYKADLETKKLGVNVQIEDNFNGESTFMVRISDIEVCEIQKECPYGKENNNE